MTLQSKALTPDQRAQVIAFITAPVDMGRGGTSTIMTAKEEYREGFAYPVRSARDPRDSSEVPRAPSWPAPKLGDGAVAHRFESTLAQQVGGGADKRIPSPFSLGRNRCGHGSNAASHPDGAPPFHRIINFSKTADSAGSGRDGKMAACRT